MATTFTRRTPTRAFDRDRASTIMAMLVTLAALLVGYLWSQSVMARTLTYNDPSGVVIQYPASWRLDRRDADSGIVRVRDADARGFPTTLELRWMLVDPNANDAEVLTTVVNTMALDRGSNLMAYKLLDLEDGQTVKGLPAIKSSYVFVETTGVFQETIPAVVLGDEVMIRKGDRVYTFNLLSTEAARPQALARFQAFVDSAQLP